MTLEELKVAVLLIAEDAKCQRRPHISSPACVYETEYIIDSVYLNGKVRFWQFLELLAWNEAYGVLYESNT